ncbi:MAG: NAD+ synthase [Chloroflexi bacterium]|nr:NAD+ synthase [Chloroflexota bacterium]
MSSSYPVLDLSINTDLVRDILVRFIRTEITRAGFQRAVVGVSGGVDSALVCFLAAEALGPENVLAVRMPYRTSSPESLEHAALVIEATGVQHRTIDITPMVDGYLTQYAPDASRVRRGNVMARSRMIVLYDQSAAFGGLVVGTGNKTEILLGYSTLYGDAAYAINPIGDLYKTQVWQLAEAVGVPEVIVQKAPSADLWVGQTDEDELGFSYRLADQILYLLVDERYRPEEVIEQGYPASVVHTIMERMRRNHYKRVMPPIAKLSHRTVGYDFLYLRDWGT